MSPRSNCKMLFTKDCLLIISLYSVVFTTVGCSSTSKAPYCAVFISCILQIAIMTYTMFPFLVLLHPLKKNLVVVNQWSPENDQNVHHMGNWYYDLLLFIHTVLGDDSQHTHTFHLFTVQWVFEGISCVCDCIFLQRDIISSLNSSWQRSECLTFLKCKAILLLQRVNGRLMIVPLNLRDLMQ